MKRLSTDERVRIVSMLVEGNSLRSISRMVGCSINTLTKFVADFGPVCEQYHDEHVRGVKAARIQADEIWAFCYAKDKNLPAHMRGQEGVGSVWTWTAIDADSKLMVSWMVGDRDAECAGRFMRDLSERLDGRCPREREFPVRTRWLPVTDWPGASKADDGEPAFKSDRQSAESLCPAAVEPDGWLWEGVTRRSIARLERFDAAVNEGRDERFDSSVKRWRNFFDWCGQNRAH